MTAKELIEELSKVPADTTVTIYDLGIGGLVHIKETEWHTQNKIVVLWGGDSL